VSAPAFRTDRATGESDVEIVMRLVAAFSPGQVIAHDTIRQALQDGLSTRVSMARVRGARVRAEGRMLREMARALAAVPGVGYRVAEATEHQTLAARRKRRADRQLGRGLALLKHVRWDEMSPETRKAHEAQLVMLSGLYEQQRAFELRMSRVERALARLRAPQETTP
jgi:hypothetical protein